MKTVRLIRAWRRFDAGRKLERTDAAAEILVQRGIAEYERAVTRKPLPKKPAEPAVDPEPAAATKPKLKPKPKAKPAAKPKAKPAPKPRAKAAAKKTPTKRTVKKGKR